MKKVLFIIPHLSTGGLPQVVLNKVSLLKDVYEIKCVEYDFLGDAFIIQRNKLLNLIGHNNLITLSQEKEVLLNIINGFNPDIISIEEFPEFFMKDEITKKIYSEGRKYKIFETTHDSSFPVNAKRWFPDKFIFVSAFNAFRYSMYDIPYEIIEYPIDKKIPNREESQKLIGLDPSYKHVVCVGLFTQRKNQGYLFEIAKKVENKKIQFHFIGNQADNFRDYWFPLMENKPNNCIIWGERSDVDKFLESSDVFFFPSRGDKNNKELNPIAIKEALVYDIPMMMFNLDVYCGKYNNNKNITFLTDSVEEDTKNLLNILNMNYNVDHSLSMSVGYDDSENKIFITNNSDYNLEFSIVIKDYLSNHTIYWFDSNFGARANWWTVPCPKQYFSNHIINNNNFRGYKIDFFNKEKTELLFSKEIIIDEHATNYMETLTVNPFNCSYINYVEFFVKKFYDDFNIDDFEIVIDAGANDGLVTELFLNKGSKKVYCFEPDKRSIKYLKKKFIDDKRVVIVEKGLYDKNEYDVKFKINNDASTVTSLESLNESHSPNQDYFLSEIVSFDKFISEYNINKISLFKIDIEGAEFDLLKSLTNEHKSMIKQFLIECHWLNESKIKTLMEVFKDDYVLEFRNHLDKNQIVPIEEIGGHEMLTLLVTNKKLVDIKEQKIPSIEIRHMLCRPTDEREIKSVESISKLGGKNVSYKQLINPPYPDLPPVDTCFRPNDISDYPGGDNLTSGHYGCYKSHIDAIMECEVKDNSIYLFFECDAILNTEPSEFINKVYEANEISKKYGYNFFSLGPVYEVDNVYHNHVSSKKLIEAHAYIIPSDKLKYVQEVIKNSKWDVFDLWVSHVFPKQRIGHFINPLSLQAKGFSLIDKKESEFNFLGMEKL